MSGSPVLSELPATRHAPFGILAETLNAKMENFLV